MSARDRIAYWIIFVGVAMLGCYVVFMVATTKINTAEATLRDLTVQQQTLKVAITRLHESQDTKRKSTGALAGIDLQSDLSDVSNEFVSYFRALAGRDRVGFSQITFNATPQGNPAIIADPKAHLGVASATFTLQGKFHSLLDLTREISNGPVLVEVQPKGLTLARVKTTDTSADPNLTEGLTVLFYGQSATPKAPVPVGGAMPGVPPSAIATPATGVPGSSVITPVPVSPPPAVFPPNGGGNARS